ncbi:MAG: serine acetyltransferase [Parapedobacter sp.]|nr:MAG: serine acetyltransferase [Parapedobacter sp.]
MKGRYSPVKIIHDIGYVFHRWKIPVIPKLFTWLNRLFFSAYVPSTAIIGKNTVFGYWGLGAVVHGRAVIGKNCVIGQNVTIGRNFGDTKVPVIGDDVYIGAGSVVFGEIVIGDNVIIGSNSVVNKSVPANCTVVGNPFRIIEQNREKKYYELDGE